MFAVDESRLELSDGSSFLAVIQPPRLECSGSQSGEHGTLVISPDATRDCFAALGEKDVMTCELQHITMFTPLASTQHLE